MLKNHFRNFELHIVIDQKSIIFFILIKIKSTINTKHQLPWLSAFGNLVCMFVQLFIIHF